MSGDNNEAGTSCCASCGIAEIDDVKLVPCDGCDLVHYCSDDCQQDHSSNHEEACKKRAAELRDELLFKQPENTHRGDCPICMIPLPLDKQKSILKSCCSKVICKGCSHANIIREDPMRLTFLCPFCREPMPETKEDYCKLMKKRIEMNDPVAMYQEGVGQRQKGNYRSAFVYYSKAAKLGDADAHYTLSILYHLGQGVEKDTRKEIYHFEEATILGHPWARYNLGCVEEDNGNVERALRHWLIAARQGEDDSLKTLMKAFKEGLISKEDLAATLRAHKAAVDETKSAQREAAEEYYRFRAS